MRIEGSLGTRQESGGCSGEWCVRTIHLHVWVIAFSPDFVQSGGARRQSAKLPAGPTESDHWPEVWGARRRRIGRSPQCHDQTSFHQVSAQRMEERLSTSSHGDLNTLSIVFGFTRLLSRTDLSLSQRVTWRLSRTRPSLHRIVRYTLLPDDVNSEIFCQNPPIISGSLAERDLQLKAF